MSTENGLIGVARARRYIRTLQERKEYLEQKIESKKAEDRPTGYEDLEVEAIDWAVPILEAAWDVLARLNREVRKIEGKFPRNVFDGDGNRVELDVGPGRMPEWDSTPVDVVTPDR